MHGRSRSGRRLRGDGTRGPLSSSESWNQEFCGILPISICAAAWGIIFLSIISVVMLRLMFATAGAVACSATNYLPSSYGMGLLFISIGCHCRRAKYPSQLPWVDYSFDSTLGYPGEGPPQLQCEQCVETDEVIRHWNHMCP